MIKKGNLDGCVRYFRWYFSGTGSLLYPTIIAFVRNHHYKWVICGINIIFGLTGIGYLAAFIWAVWPQKTAFIDVITNDPTTNSAEAGKQIYGQMGANVGAYKEARDRGTAVPSPITSSPSKVSTEDYHDELRNLASLRAEGIITEEDFVNKKKSILGI